MTAATELRSGLHEKAQLDLTQLLAAMGSAAALCDRWGDVLGMAPTLERRVGEMDPRARTAWFAAVRFRVTRWSEGADEWHGELAGWRAHLYRVDVPGPRHVVVRFELPRAAGLPARIRAELTPREADVAAGILEGMDSRSIAARHGVSVHTVRRVTERLFTKLRIHKRSQLTYRALGLLEVGQVPHSARAAGA